jgi:predicted porin
LGGQWDFGVAKLQAHISRDRNGPVDGKGFLVGGLVPVGAGEIRLAYSQYEVDLAGDPRTRKLALGYVHNLSKRTAVYTTYARVKNNGGAAFGIGGAGTTAANTGSNGFDFGVRHSF